MNRLILVCYYLSAADEKELFYWYLALTGKSIKFGNYMYAQPASLGPDNPWGYIDIEEEYVELALLKFPFLRVKSERPE
jgi:hypothetical protein